MLEEKLVGTLSDYENIKGNLSEPEIKSELEAISVEVPIKDHNKLDNRDLPNQHPIDAIEGLKEELLSIKSNQQSTSLSIKKLESKIDNKLRTVSSIPTDMKVGQYIFLEKESE